MTNVRHATTLPGSSEKRKEYPILEGVLGYFPAAIARLARHSFRGNQKHNKGEPLHHARGKSSDHGSCIIRHLMDIADLRAAMARGQKDILNYTAPDGVVHESYPLVEAILEEHDALVWRSCALSQEANELLVSAPLAPFARLG